MMHQCPTILALAGSLRTYSINRKLLNIGVEQLHEAGANVVLVDLRDYPLPLYDGDLEEEHGVPQAARELRRLMMDCHGLLIASPEYNGSVSGVLKNMLDWCSRPADDGPALAPYSGKAVALMSASPSPFGGVRGIGHLRASLGKMGAVVLGEDVALPLADNAFDADGRLKSAASLNMVSNLSAGLVKLAGQLQGQGGAR